MTIYEDARRDLIHVLECLPPRHDAAVRAWLDSKRGTCSPSTLKIYARAVGRLCAFFPDRDLKQLSVHDLAAFAAHVTETSAVSTAYTTTAICKPFLSHVHSRRIADAMATALTTRSPDRGPPPDRLLSAEEVDALLQASVEMHKILRPERGIRSIATLRTLADSDNDGWADGAEGFGAYDGDADGDGVPNMLDDDADDDGFLDGAELGLLDLNPLIADYDGDGIPDGRDIHPKSALELLRLDLDKLVVKDPVDCECFVSGAYRADAYVSRVWVSSDKAGADVVLNLDNAELEAMSIDGVGRKYDRTASSAGNLNDFTVGSIPIRIPQDLSLYVPDKSSNDIKLYLWMNVHDKDVENDDQLDVGGRATPMWGDAGKTYYREVSLRKDAYQEWGTILDINGEEDESTGNRPNHDEDDVSITAQFLERVPMELVTELIKHSQFV